MAAQPAPGTLDPTFGGGVQTLRPLIFLADGSWEPRDADARDVAVDAVGRVVVVGRTDNFHDWDAALVVYHRHGALVAFVETAFAPGSDDVASAVALQPDGRAVIAGSTRPTTGGLPAVAVARYELQDSPVLDGGFGFGGQRLIHLPGGAQAAAIAIQPDGRILVAGVTGEGAVGTGWDAFVVRLTAAGALDATFGSGGVVRLTINGQQQATGIALATGGRILLAARAAEDMLLFRLDANGALDDTFGSFGVVVGSNRPGNALVLQPDGRMVVPGVAYVNGVSHPAAARYRSSGSADPAFGQGGVVRSEHMGDGADAVVEESGRVVVAGSVLLEGRPEPYLWALGPDGVPDASFAPKTVGRRAVFNAIVRQADGRLVAVGTEDLGLGFGRQMVIARYVGDTPDVIFKDDFEDWGLSWTVSWSTSSAPIGPAFAAAVQGSFGLQTSISSTNSAYVQDDTPQGEPRYRARFYLHPRDFDPGEAQGHRRTRTFIAFSEGPQRRVAAIVLRRLNGAYAVMGRARLDDNAQADSAWVALDSAPHAIELDLKASSGPDANDGWLHLWVDGAPAATLDGLDNSRGRVDSVRLGALSLKSGASGTLSWDEFESRRETYIGP